MGLITAFLPPELAVKVIESVLSVFLYVCLWALSQPNRLTYDLLDHTPEHILPSHISSGGNVINTTCLLCMWLWVCVGKFRKNGPKVWHQGKK